jgi:hypothetical protein
MTTRTPVGPVELLAFVAGPPARYREVLAAVEDLRGRGVVRLLDALFVTRLDDGDLVAYDPDRTMRDEDLRGTSLWQLLRGTTQHEGLNRSILDFEESGEIGLDLGTVEGVTERIEPGLVTLLLLVEHRWAITLRTRLSHLALRPLFHGFLTAEAMLVVSSGLAAVTEDCAETELADAVHGATVLDALTADDKSSRKRTGRRAWARDGAVAAETLRRLVVAGVIDDTEVGRALDALVTSGLLPRDKVVEARAHADAARRVEVRGQLRIVGGTRRQR